LFTLTLVELEYETSVSIWEYEMMIVVKWYLCLHFGSYTIEFTKHKWSWFI